MDLLRPLVAPLRRLARSSSISAAAVRCGGVVFLLVGLAGTASAQMSIPGKFSVNPSGAATYSVPIVVPPGTAGMLPALSLEYNSQAGNGIVGIGWSLAGLPSVARCPRTMAQDGVRGSVNFDTNDRFCLDGQRLIAINGTYGADGTEYRTEIESFNHIISHGNSGSGPTWFEVMTKSGQIMWFGNSADSRVMVQNNVRSWLVNRVFDRAGNYFAVQYTSDPANGQAYPAEIDYTANDTAGLAPFNKVQFVYGSRPDVTTGYHVGSSSRTTVLLTEIKTFTDRNGNTFVGNGSVLVGDYKLAYQQLGTIPVSHLTSVTLCAGDGTCLPPTTFGWVANTGGSFVLNNQTLPTNYGSPSSNPCLPIGGDFNNDGKTDFALFCEGQLDTYLSNGNGTFARHSQNNNVNSAGCTPISGDFNGDGNGDFLLICGSTLNAYLSNADGTFTLVSSFGGGPGGLPAMSNCAPIGGDFDGDGRTDFLLYCGTSMYTFLSNGNGTFTFTLRTASVNYTSSACSSIGGDFNGDGKTDFALYCGTVINAFLSNGDGTFTLHSGAYTYLGSPPTAGCAQLGGDFNGDGNTDFAFVCNNNLFAFLSTGDGNFAYRFQQLPASYWSPPSSTNCVPMSGDFNNDGKTDFIISCATSSTSFVSNGDGSFVLITQSINPASGQAPAPSCWPFGGDFNGDGKSDVLFVCGNNATSLLSLGPGTDLMPDISTGLGANTTIFYMQLTNTGALGVYTKGTSTYPTIDLSSPLYVVGRIDVDDGIGGVRHSLYSYVGGRVDLNGRGFLGFAEVDTTDLQTNVRTYTTIRQDYPYVGMVSSVLKTLNFAEVNFTTNSYGSSSLGGTRYQVFLTQSVESSNDADGTALPTVTTTYQYDAYNNATQVTVSASDGFSKVSANTYSNNTANWVLGRLLNASVTSSAPGQASATRTSSFAYDPTTGFLTQEVVEPNTSSLRLETDYVYDAFGNKIQTTVSGIDIATRSSTTVYDSQGRFAIQRTNALSQSEFLQYDARFGAPTSHTDPNGVTTAWTYDAFGRKTLEVRPDSNRTQWQYRTCPPDPCQSGVPYYLLAVPEDQHGAQNGPMSAVEYDMLDRELYRSVQGFDGSWLAVQTQYDTFGRVSKRSRPFFLFGGTPQWTSYAYDGLNRVTTATLPDGSTNQHAYHGLVTVDTNGNGQTRTLTKNSQGKVVSAVDALNNTTNFSYDAFGNLLTTTDPKGNVVANSYDTRGRKIASNDPDLGAWSYAYDTLGELLRQTDAKGQISNFSYDVLGRLTQRVEPDMTSAWIYDTAPNGIGKLASARVTAGIGTGYQRSISYEGLGRPYQVSTTIEGITLNFYAAYDVNGRLAQVVYPSGVTVNYGYNALGYSSTLTDATSGLAYWTALARDQEMHLTQERAGNGVAAVRGFDPATGRLLSIGAGNGNAVASFSYNYDFLGNLTARTDWNDGVSEFFGYDALNRLTSNTVNLSPSPLVKTFSYDSTGNLLNKSDVGSYVYPLTGQPHPHAVTSINGAISTSFTYDLNGNQTSGLGRTVAYASYNKPASITQGTRSLFFYDDVDHQRFKQVTPEGRTWYLDAFGVHAELFLGSITSWNDYLMVGGSMVGTHINRSNGSTNVRYFHQDHLGSIAVITDESGAVVERDSYDSWGKRRFLSGADDPSGSLNSSSQTSRGFTGQEFLADVALVHLNGRVYDPQIGRMMSADPFVPDPLNGQTWNRYSYVLNNPLAFTDPNGYCWFICRIFHAVEHFFSNVFRAIINFVRQNIGAIVQIAAIAFLCPPPVTFACSAGVGIGASTVIAGITTGRLGLALKAGLIAGVTASAFNVVGNITAGISGFGGQLFNIAGHALVGCAQAAASGAECGPSALSGGVTSLAAMIIPDQGFRENLVINTVLGGLVSIAGGGKFANGALTAAFGYVFNHALHMVLNSQPVTTMTCDDCGTNGGESSYKVFSGLWYAANNPGYAGLVDVGPIPPGRYYIVDEPQGGFFTRIWNSLIGVDHSQWFALYSDQTNSDTVKIQGSIRGQFRLHPVGPLGLSEGCVTVCSIRDFNALSTALRRGATATIPGTSTKTYGTLSVTTP